MTSDASGKPWDVKWIVYNFDVPGDADNWAYHPRFERMHVRYATEHPRHVWATESRLHQKCVNLRKSGRLPYAKERITPYRMPGEWSAILKGLYKDQNLNFSRLAYTPQFDSLYTEFLARTGSELSKWIVLKAIRSKCKNRKNGWDRKGGRTQKTPERIGGRKRRAVKDVGFGLA